jgi:hypothetical protein
VIIDNEYSVHASSLAQHHVAGIAGDPPSFSQRALSSLAAFCRAAAFALLEDAHMPISNAAAIPSSNSDPNPEEPCAVFFMQAESHGIDAIVIGTIHV